MISPHSSSAAKGKESTSGHAKRRIFLIDEHPICRHGMAQLINSEEDLVVCGEAETATQALAALRLARGELVLLDLAGSGASDLESVRQLRQHFSDIPLIAISSQEESLFALQALRAGAQGYLLKREGLSQFIEAVRKVLAGQIYLNPTFGEQLIFQLARGQEPASPSPVDRLTERELDVLRLLGAGKATKQIAQTLNVSHKTIETHRLHIKEKLGIASASELVRFAVAWSGQQS